MHDKHVNDRAHIRANLVSRADTCRTSHSRNSSKRLRALSDAFVVVAATWLYTRNLVITGVAFVLAALIQLAIRRR